MAWSDLTFTGCSVLTAAQMTALQANFAALGQGAPGAPPIAPTSLMWSGQASGGALTLSSMAALAGLTVSQVASIGTLSVAGGMVLPALAVTGASSLAGVEVSSRWVARTAIITEQASVAALHVASGAAAHSLLLQTDAGSTPAANTLYRGLLPKAWCNFDGTGTVAFRDEENCAGLTDNGAGNYTIDLDRDFADTNYSFTGFARRDNDSGNAIAIVQARASDTKTVGALQIRTKFGTGNPDLTDFPEVNLHFFGRQ